MNDELQTQQQVPVPNQNPQPSSAVNSQNESPRKPEPITPVFREIAKGFSADLQNGSLVGVSTEQK